VINPPGISIVVNPYTPGTAYPSAAQPLAIQETVTGTCNTGSSNCYYNFLDIVSDNAVVGAVNSGAGATALRIDNHFGGPAMIGGRGTVDIRAELTATSGNTGPRLVTYAALTAAAEADANDNGTGVTISTSLGQVETVNIIASLQAAATNFRSTQGGEVDTNLASGSSTYQKVGWQITQLSTDAVQGSVIDAALAFVNQSGAIGWTNGILFGDVTGVWPFTGGATVIACANCGTAASFIDMSSATFSANFLKSSNFSVNGAGTIFTASTTTPTIAAGTVAIAGITTAPTFSGTTGGSLFITGGGGFHLVGEGTVSDITIGNKTSAAVLTIPTGTVNATFSGNISALGTVTLGQNSGTGGAITLNGSTSGSETLSTPVAGGSLIFSSAILTAAAPTVGASQIGYGATVEAPAAGTCPAGTVGSSTPQSIVNCIIVNVAGTAHYVPYF
jgi:hypothetical protein